MYTGNGEIVAISGLAAYVSGRENEVSVVSVSDHVAGYDFIWQRDIISHDEIEVSIVGQLPPLDKIRELISLTSPEMLQVENFDLMQEIAESMNQH